MLKDILKNVLTEDVLTESLQNEIESKFNELVEIKSTEIAQEEIEKEKAVIAEEYEEKFQKFNKEIVEKLDEFLDNAIEDLYKKVESSLNENLDNVKTQTILEAFDNLVLTSGIELLKIKQGFEEQSENSFENLAEKYDALVQRNHELKKENISLIKNQKISESITDLSLVESDKFKKVAELFDFDENFETKLKTLKESIKGSDTSKEEVITEKVEEKKVDKPRVRTWQDLV